MSYNFGQFRRSQGKSDDFFISNIDVEIQTIKTKSEVLDSKEFTDKIIKKTNGDNFSINENYYFRLSIKKDIEYPQSIVIQLFNSNKIEDNTQKIQKISIPGNSKDTYIYECIINPNDEYDQIQFILQRNINDYLDPDLDRIIDFTIEKAGIVKNIIPAISGQINNKKILKQIGVQSAPGLGMCINGEMIKVGNSGIFEIKNGIDINFIGFLIDNNFSENNKYFVLDYQY